MADISIIQTHQMGLKKARAAAQKAADKMAAEFDVGSKWSGDVLVFSRSGLSGTLAVQEKEAQLDMKLGIMLKAFAPVIEEKVTQSMKKVFSGQA
jgi:putative polyhydroxyalkanoate system protein